MLRLFTFCLVLVCCVSCGQRKSSEPVVMHVLRDPRAQFAERLRQADGAFAFTEPHLENGKPIIVATNEGNSYTALLGRIAKIPPSLLIVDPQAPLPAEVWSQLRPESLKLVCGGTAYILENISAEQREAAELYLQFLEGHCESK
jgi:hypothetical protein